MKQLLTAIILLSTFQFCFAQDIIGKWYMVNRSGLIEFSITKDSIKTQQLFSDFTPKDQPGQSDKYIKTVRLSDRILVISKSKEDTTKFAAMTFINLIDKKYFQLAWNIRDTSTNDIETLIQIHKNDNRQLFGYYAFSENYTTILKQMKPISSISLEEFKKYLTVYIDKIKLTEKDAEIYNTAYLSGFTYNFQLISQSLYDIGFNPLQNTSTTDPVYKKYYKNPEVKKIIEDATQK